MTASTVRVTVPRPPQPTYIPGRCYALKTPDDTKTHCMAKGARLYPVGWRCDDCAPGSKTSRETSPTREMEAA